jgi:hypothetical protein
VLRPHPLALVALLSTAACEPHADVDVVLHDQCKDAPEFQATRSVRITLLGEAGFDENGQLTACAQPRAPCFEIQAASFEELKEILKRRGVVLTARPGVGQGIVVTGFRDPACTPEPATKDPLTFCGYQLAPLPDEDTQLFVLLSCPDGIDQVCWPHLFAESCGP